MENFGSDYLTIVDEDGVEYELEALCQLDYNGSTYVAVIPAADAEDGEAEDLEISLLRYDEDEEDPEGEPILSAITDENELNAVYELMMQMIESDADESDVWDDDEMDS